MKVAVIVARFQTPHLHEGHRSLIDEVISKHNRVVIVLGVNAVPGTKRNPFDYHTRERMLKQAYPEVVVLPLHDMPEDAAWSLQLDGLLCSTFPASDFVLYGSRDSFIPMYCGRYETCELKANGDHNATVLREQCGERVSDSEDFRAGIVYAYHRQYNKVYATVDIAVWRNNKQELLLGRKDIDNKWRLPGGFSDPEDTGFEAAAKRELKEECGDIAIGKLAYETSMRIDDWRYRAEADKIISTLFSCEHEGGTATAGDDIAEVRWFKINDVPAMLQRELICHEHQPMLKFLIDKYL